MNETIDHQVIDVKGVRVSVTLVPDWEVNPGDADCYTPDDKAAWLRDEWRYVGVIVTLTDHPEIGTSLCGVEYGTAPSWSVDLNRIISEYPVPDMIADLLPRVHVAHSQLATIMELWRGNE